MDHASRNALILSVVFALGGGALQLSGYTDPALASVLAGGAILALLYIPYSWAWDWLSPATLSDEPRPKPNYEEWDKRKGFRLVEIAWLWEDLEPAGYDLPENVRRRFDELHSDIKEKRLQLHDRTDIRETIHDAYDYHSHGRARQANPDWIVTRDDARSYAYLVGETPPFLFPRERVTSDQASVHTMLETILRPGWIIHHNPNRQTARKPISFNADGSIGEGGNDLEHSDG